MYSNISVQNIGNVFLKHFSTVHNEIISIMIRTFAKLKLCIPKKKAWEVQIETTFELNIDGILKTAAKSLTTDIIFKTGIYYYSNFLMWMKINLFE